MNRLISPPMITVAMIQWGKSVALQVGKKTMKEIINDLGLE